MQASITFGAFAATDDVARIRHPDGLIDAAGNLNVHVYAPTFGFSFRLMVRYAGTVVYDQRHGSRDHLLPRGVDVVVTVPLPARP